MKSIINKNLFALAAALLSLTACQSEPEVGSLLYSEETDNSPKLYVYETQPNYNIYESVVKQTPSALVLPEDTMSFYVKLSQPLNEDVVVTAFESPQLAEQFDSDYPALAEGAVTFNTKTVTIPAGQTVSTTPVVVSLSADGPLLTMEDRGCIAVTFASTPIVNVKEGYDAYYWKITKKVQSAKAN